METETPTPTSTPTDTPTPTATFTPTPNYYVELTTPAGEPARIAREVSIADVVTIFLLFALLVSIWGMYFSNRLKGGR